MKLWAIREAGTNRYLMRDQRHAAVGVTHVEPKEHGVPFLYITERGARQALKWWKEGETTVRWTGGGGYFSDDGPEEDWRTKPVPSRGSLVMEVVPLTLTEKCENVDIPGRETSIT